MKKVLAISGGVDSAVLLFMFRDDPDVVVAHFDHGTRASSAEDARFVETLATKYGLPFYLGRAELGSGASEEQARISRYEYLEKLASELDGEIYTAHHLDDLAESMAINLVRGTGWRGLVPFGNNAIRRPFTDIKPMNKADILRYAAEHNLSFRQDPTNTSGQYLRNILREKLGPKAKKHLLEIYHETNNLKIEIDAILDKILPKDGVYERAWFSNLDNATAIEILRAGLLRAGISVTRPQALDFLDAIRTYKPGKHFNLPGDRLVEISKNTLSLK